MLKEVKEALFVTEPDFDTAIADLIKEAVADLRIAGVLYYEGTIDFSYGEDGTVAESCSITDDLIIRFIKTYARVNFGSPPDYDRLKASLDMQRRTLQHSTGYGRAEAY